MKHYSIIWDGSEDSIKEQMNFVAKWARDNLIRVQHWKDKTIQERVCQYVGNPKKKDKEWRFTRNNLSKKYTILEMNDEHLLKFKALVGKPFQYETDTQKEYIVIDAFTAIKHSDTLSKDYYFNSVKEKFNSEDDAVKEAEARLTLNPNQKRTFTVDARVIRGTTDKWKRLNEIIVTEHTALFQPWVVLDDAGLEQAGAEITKHSGVDTAALQKRESAIIAEYNRLNNLCGRRISVPNDASDAVKEAFTKRKDAERELKEVRRELGSAKRKMTTAAKKGEGIECDLTAFSVL
jgi:hypothetical protein